MKAKKNLQDLPYREKLLKLSRLYSIHEIQKKISNSRLTNKQIESLLKKNNVLLLEFDKYGILKKKEFYDKEKMKKVDFAKKGGRVTGIAKRGFGRALMKGKK